MDMFTECEGDEEALDLLFIEVGCGLVKEGGELGLGKGLDISVLGFVDEGDVSCVVDVAFVCEDVRELFQDSLNFVVFWDLSY